MKKLFSMFSRKNRTLESKNDSKYFEGLELLSQANELFHKQMKDEEALSLYDRAVECGVEEAYINRAFCLQSLKYHYEAIEDFDKAIQNNPDDANLYFGRANSKSAIVDFGGRVADIRIAVKLSGLKSNSNEIYNTAVKEQGYKSAEEFYLMQLSMATQIYDMADKNPLVKKKFIENMDVKIRKI